MHENEFLAEPPRVVLYDPVTHKCNHIYVFLGAVPKTVVAAVTAKNGPKLREYYGASYKSLLLLDADPATALLPPKVPLRGESDTVRASNNPTKAGGRDDEADFSDIETLLMGPPRITKKHNVGVASDGVGSGSGANAATLAPGITYITDVHLFPEDKFIELKEKIYLATGVPLYRQHLFYMDQERVLTTYILSADGVYDTDIRKVTQHTDDVFGIPVDKGLYESRDRNRVDAYDSFKLIGDTGIKGPQTFYVVDMDTFVARSRSQVSDLAHDPFQFDILYYGFIGVYFPMLTHECFRDYVAGEAEMALKYPDLAPNREVLESIYNTERNIISSSYHNAAAVEKVLRGFGIAITQMTAYVAGSTLLNIRNLFDKLRCSRYVPEIRAYVENNRKHYMLRKTHVKNGSTVQFPAGSLMRSGITIAVSLRAKDQESYHAKSTISTMENEQNRYLFLNIQQNGAYYVRTVWNEEDEFGFVEILKIMKKFVDPIVNGINNLGRAIFMAGSKLALMTKANLAYQSLTICVFFRRILSDGVFKMFKQHWEKYIQARIVTTRNVQQGDRYELLFRKCVHQFDTSLIERIMSASSGMTLLNQYAYLSNNTVRQKWAQNYDGRVIRMTHRTTDVRFEVIDIREDDFAYFLTYLSNFVYSAMNDPAISSAISAVKSYKDVRKLKKLREQDPELYNLKKHGSNRIYSILCQNPRQPLIYTAEEITAMPAAQVKKLTQYWNFTLNKPAYYGCPNSVYPHLSFITGIHPKNYCLPCCNKKEQGGGASKKYRINSSCISDHTYDEDDRGGISRHIMGYGKVLDTGRLSKVPPVVKNLLFGTTSGPISFYIYGVPQHVPAVEHIGVLFAAAAALEMTPEDLAESIAARLLATPSMFYMLIGGALSEFFSDVAAVTTTIRELFVEHKLFSVESQRFRNWSGLFIEALHMLFRVSTYTFIDVNVDGNVELYVDERVKAEAVYINKAQLADTKCVLMIKQRNKYYPIFAVDPPAYFNNDIIASRTFSYSDDIISVLCSAVKFAAKQESARIGRTPDLQLMVNFAAATGKTIEKCYANKQNLCYGVAVAGGGSGGIYFPVDYSAHSGIPVTFDSLTRAEAPPHSAVVALIAELNDYIEKHQKTENGYKYHKIVPGDYYGMTAPEFFRAGRLVFHFAAEKVAPFKVVGHDYLAVNAAILRREPPIADARTERLGECVYVNYLYQLFVAEFVNYINNERNEQLREQVRGLIDNTNFRTGLAEFRAKLGQMLADYPADRAVIQGMITTFYTGNITKAELLARIAEGSYDFDRVTMAVLRSTPRDAIKPVLAAIVDKFAVERDFDPRGVKISNVYQTCADSAESYCDKKRLIVNRPLGEFVDLLAADFTNDLKARYLLNSAADDVYVSYFDFTKVPTEVITIYLLNK